MAKSKKRRILKTMIAYILCVAVVMMYGTYGVNAVSTDPASGPTVAYSANGGTGTDYVTSPYTAGSEVKVLANNAEETASEGGPNFTKEGYLFKGWSVDKSADQPEYKAGDTIKVTENGVKLYAVWEADSADQAAVNTQAKLKAKRTAAKRKGGANTVEVGRYDELIGAITNAGSTPTTIELTKDINIIDTKVLTIYCDVKTGQDITIIPSGKDIIISRASDNKGTPFFTVESGGKLTLKSDGGRTLTLSGNEVSASTPAVQTAGTFETDNVTFKDNISTGDGGAISATAGTVTLNDSTFRNNSAKNGGAIKITSGTLTSKGSLFENNKTTETGGSGGAIYAIAKSKVKKVKLESSTFEGNSATGGGAVWLTETDSTVDSCTFSKNKAVLNNGGAIFNQGDGVMTVNSAKFTNNTAFFLGGAVYNDDGASQIYTDKTAFENNRSNELAAEAGGGAIWDCPLGTTNGYTFAGVSFHGNTAAQGGDDICTLAAKAGYERGGGYIAELNYAGESLGWCKDTNAHRYTAGDAEADPSYYQNVNTKVDLHSTLSVEKYKESAGDAKIVFSGNEARSGGAIANNGEVTLGQKSGLIITKEVKGDGAPAGDTFEFTVTFSDDGTYDGVASGSKVTIKAGEKRVIAGVPAGTKYTITESDKTNYTPAEKTITGTIAEYGSTAAFVNTYKKTDPVGPASGAITISKSVRGDGAPAGDTFEFTVTFDGGGTYDGVASGSKVTIKAGEKRVIAGVPAGTKYTITESNKTDYTADQKTITGTVTEQGSTAAFVNTYKKPDTPAASSIIVKKVWSDDNDKAGKRPDKIEVKLLDRSTGVDTGKTLTLSEASGWTGEFKDADIANYVVAEKSVRKYAVKYAVSGNKCTITNTYDPTDISNDPNDPNGPKTPGTGDTFDYTLWCVLLLAGCGAIAAVLITRKKHGRK